VNPRDLERQRQLLADRREELIRQGMRSVRTGRTRNQADMGIPHDEGDEAVRILETDMEFRRSELDMAIVAQIEAAIDRIDAGEYGVCVDCGAEIERERLAAVPWAVRCTVDQEAFEHQRGEPMPPTL
jgi:DnaK suppressor protein